MNKQDLIKKLKEEDKKRDLDQLRTRWNRRAPGFPTDLDEKQINSFNFLEQFISLSGTRILDIGCGTGRYMKLALERGAKETVGLEIADEMLVRAQDNLYKAGFLEDTYRLVLSSWEEIDLQERDWTNTFDLVMAIKTPALDTAANVQKMLDASRQGFFFSNHIMRAEPLFEELYFKFHGSRKVFGNKRNYLVNDLLKHWGYDVKVHVFESKGNRSEPIEDLMLRYGDWIFADFATDDERKRLKDELLKVSTDGRTVKHSVMTKEALNYVDLRKN